jgi:hypothetical protein
MTRLGYTARPSAEVPSAAVKTSMNMTTGLIIAMAVATLATFAAGTAHAIEIPGGLTQLRIPADTRSKILRTERQVWDFCHTTDNGRVISCTNSRLTANLEITRPSTTPQRLLATLTRTSEKCCASMSVEAPFHLRTRRVAGRFRVSFCQQYSRSKCEAFRASADKEARSPGVTL